MKMPTGIATTSIRIPLASNRIGSIILFPSPIGGIIDAVRIFDLPWYLWQLRQVLAVFAAPCDPWHFSQALRVGNSTSLVDALLRAVVWHASQSMLRCCV